MTHERTMYWWVLCDWGRFLWPMTSHPTKLVVEPEEILDQGFNLESTRFSSDEEDEDGRRLPDFGSYQSFAFFMSLRAVEALRDTFTGNGRFLKTHWDGLVYHLAVVDRELDLFDYERSTYTRWGLYDDLKRDVWEIDRVILRTPPPDCPDIFRLKGHKSVHLNIIVSDRFKRIYEENGFTGLLFHRALLPLN